MASYQIYQFDGVALPLYNPETDHSTGAAGSTLRRSIGGVFDTYGARQRLPDIVPFGIRGIYAGGDGNTLLVDHSGNHILDHSGNRILVATAAQWLRLQVDELRSRIGVRGTIWRRRWDNLAVAQWKTARLLSIKESGNTELRTALAEFDLAFETAHAAWRSAAASTVSGNLVSGGLLGLNATSSGNAPVTDPVITIAASGAITSIVIGCVALGVDLRWAGTLSPGQALVIDCGAMSVLQAGGNAYSGLTLGAGHTARGWLPLNYGINVVTIYANGAGTASISHYDKFI
jgi:hypothetical protein